MGKKAKVIDEQGQELITLQDAQRGRSLLASFGSRKEIDEMVDRILRSPQSMIYDPTLRAQRKIKQSEALQVAMISIAHGLSFFSGELYATFSKRGGFKVGIGRDGWSKALAHALDAEGGGHAWPIFRRVLNPEERDEVAAGAPVGAIIYVCELHDSRTHDSYERTVRAMSESGASWQEIKEYAGRPFISAVGWYAPTDDTKNNDENYPPIERAKKRAYCAAVKLRARLPFDVGEAAEELPDEYTGVKLSDRPAASETIVEQKASETVVEQKASETVVEQKASETVVEQKASETVVEQRKSDARAVFGDEATDAASAVVEQVAETPLEVERKRYTALFNQASKLKLKPTPLSIKDSAAMLKGKADALEAKIKAAQDTPF